MFEKPTSTTSNGVTSDNPVKYAPNNSSSLDAFAKFFGKPMSAQTLPVDKVIEPYLPFVSWGSPVAQPALPQTEAFQESGNMSEFFNQIASDRNEMDRLRAEVNKLVAEGLEMSASHMANLSAIREATIVARDTSMFEVKSLNLIIEEQQVAFESLKKDRAGVFSTLMDERDDHEETCRQLTKTELALNAAHEVIGSIVLQDFLSNR